MRNAVHSNLAIHFYAGSPHLPVAEHGLSDSTSASFRMTALKTPLLVKPAEHKSKAVPTAQCDAAELPDDSGLHNPADSDNADTTSAWKQKCGKKRKEELDLSTNPFTKRTRDWKHSLSGRAEVLVKAVDNNQAARTKARAWARRSHAFINAETDNECEKIMQAAVDAKVAER